MTNSRKAQVESEFDSTGARKGIGEVKTAAVDMANAVAAAGDKAGKAVDGIGSGAGESAGKLDRATKSIIGSIERTTAAMKAGERGTANYFETLAGQRGANTDALKPYLDQLRQAEAAQRAASGSLDKIGVSAKQTAAAMRGVPAQFTDIVTSIQGGQQPLTVFLQQGGQLKDMFGGAGNAARALGTYVLGLVNPFTLAAAAGAGLAAAYSAGAAESQAYRRELILTGNAAGVTAGQLADMAAAVRGGGAGSQGRAAEILAQIAGYAAVGATNMTRFTAAALQFERVGGPAAEETAKAFADLAKAPLAGALKLNEVTNFLTRSTYEQIKALEDQGRTVDAARVAQEAYTTAIEQRAPQLLQTLGLVERAWLAIKGATKGGIDAVLGIGRENGTQQQLDALQERLARAKAAPSTDRFYDGNGQQVASRKAAVDAIQAQIEGLRQGAKYEALSAAYAAERAAAVKAGAEWDKETDKYLSKQAQASREITKAEQLGLAAGKSRADIEKQVAAIREKYAEKSSKTGGDPFSAERDAAKEWAKYYGQFSDALTEAEGKTAQLTKSQVNLVKFLDSPAYQNMAEPARQLALQQAYAAITQEQLNESAKAGAKIAADAAREYAKWLDEIKKGGDAAVKQADQLKIEAEASGLVIEGYRSLEQAIQLVEIARLKERQTAMMGDPEAVIAIQREIDARRELIDLIGGKEARKAAADAAKQAGRDWEKVTDQIGQSLTDALMTGGKSASEQLKNLFKTLVLRPLLQPLVQGGVNYVAQLAGLATGTSTGTAGSLGSIGSLYSTGSALYKGYGAVAAYLGGSGAVAGSGIAAGAGATYGTIGGTAGTYGSISGSIGTGSLGTGASAGSGAASSFAAAAPYVAAIIAGLAVSNDAYSKGFTVQNVDSKFLESMSPSFLTARAFNSLGIGNDKWNNIFSGASGLAKLFGRGAPQVTESGITGSISGGDFTGQAYRDILEKGGWFRSDKRYTQTAGLTDDISTYLDVASRSVLEQTKAFGAAIGLPAEQLAGVTAQVRIKIGSDAEANKAAIIKALSGYTDALVETFKDQVEPLRQYGETTAQTIERVGSALTNANDILQALGQSALAASIAGGQAAVQLETAFGGADAFGSAANSFLNNFYTDAQRAAIASQQLSKQLGELGISTLPATREAYKALALSQDLTTDSGRTLYAALLQLAPAFAQVVGVTDDLTAASAKAVQQVMASLLSDRNSLDVALLTSQGRSTEAKALQRQQDLDKITTGLTETDAAAAIAAYDYNAAMREQIDALDAAASAQATANDQRTALEGQLLQAQGNIAELRARELAALDPSNRALQERINALQDAQAAADAAGSLRDAWASIGDTITEEVKRIRGLAAAQSSTLAGAQAQFAIATAKARAGDQTSAQSLPELSRTVLDLAAAGATSAQQLAILRASVASSLTQTADLVRASAETSAAAAEQRLQQLKSTPVGTPVAVGVAPDSTATAPAVATLAALPETTATSNTQAMLAELSALRTEVAGLRDEARATASYAGKLSRLHTDWDARGLLVRTDADQPLATVPA